ncbi:hypothetical protein OJF2_51830 [Aquisphaera giovannonii]|uniref:Uncharacterized protein n=1 Tax=Aquisphaera giovannonii TaxID=406548 RepID=A0A5B9W8V3_9BACT|nr:hypothetical protein OJF2_51830 [Aquisphaera giovannonii]
MLFAPIDYRGLFTLGAMLLSLVSRTVDHHLKQREGA